MTDFPTDATALTHILVVSDPTRSRAWYTDVLGATFLTEPVTSGAETRAFFRDPDGHLFEISEYRG